MIWIVGGEGKRRSQFEDLRALGSGDVDCRPEELHRLTRRPFQRSAHRRPPVHFGGKVAIGVRVHQIRGPCQLSLGLASVAPEQQHLSQHRVKLR